MVEAYFTVMSISYEKVMYYGLSLTEFLLASDLYMQVYSLTLANKGYIMIQVVRTLKNIQAYDMFALKS
jgi:hypothetical protein